MDKLTRNEIEELAVLRANNRLHILIGILGLLAIIGGALRIILKF